MRNLTILVLLGVVGFLLSGKWQELASISQPSKEPDPRPQLISTIDRQIAALLSPMPLNQQGTLPYANAHLNISRVRHDVLQHYAGSAPKHIAARQVADRLCDLLLSVATERNSYIRRINEARSSTQASALVDSGPAYSSSTLSRWHKRQDDAIARKAELDGRIKWWESTVSRQWDARCQELRRQTDFHCAQFRAALQ